MAQCTPPPRPRRCISRQEHCFLVECAAPRASVLSAAREPQQRENRNVSKRRDKTRLFCRAVAAPRRRALFRAVSCEARVLRRVLSVKALGIGEFASVGKTAACCRVWPQEVGPFWPGTPFPWLSGRCLNFSKVIPKHRPTVPSCPRVLPSRPEASRASRGGGVGGVFCTNTQPRHVPCRAWGETSLFLHCPAVLARKWPQCSFLACRSP